MWGDFIDKVVSGEQVVGKLVRLAVERHLNDLERVKDDDFGYYFDEDAAHRSIKIVKMLRHTKGELARKHFDLQPWQAFIVASIFGWKRKADGRRRYRKSYCEVARKNGKSELADAIGIAATFFDGEYGAEGYSAATTRDQAKIVFDGVKTMVKMLLEDSPAVAKALKVMTNQVVMSTTNSKFLAVSSDYDTMDGFNPHVAVIDEYHAHKTDGILGVLETGMGSRVQPLLFVITTAGFNTESPCYHLRKVCVDILEKNKVDDTMFAMIFCLDEDDDWQDESVWVKANPNIGTTPTWDFMRSATVKAVNEGYHSQVQFRTKNLNQWMRASHVWMPLSKWDAVGPKEPWSLETMRATNAVCFGGLDLSSTRDVTAFCLLFPPTLGWEHPRLKWWLFIPQETAHTRALNNGIDYLRWAEDGWITLTDGDWIDYDFIADEVLRITADLQVEACGYDRWHADHTVARLINAGMKMHPISQTSVNMNAPVKMYEKMLLSGEIEHDNNPVLRWMLGNVDLKTDSGGNVKFNKAKAANKIDGHQAAAMAIAEWMTAGTNSGRSIYETRDLIIL